MTIQTEARNASLDDLVPMLIGQHDLKVDAVVPATAIRSEGAVLKVKGIQVFGDAQVRPTAIMDGHIATRLDIPVKYVRRMRSERPDLYDANVNGWIHGSGDKLPMDAEGMVHFQPCDDMDKRRFLLRTFSDPEGGEGIGRALLSDHYAPIEHLDVLFAALDGIKESGTECQVVRANLSETRMNVRFAAPGIAALAPTLLKGYNAPVPGWGDLNRIREVAGREGKGYEPGSEPIVFAGFDVDNSETGGGAFSVTPVLTVQICGNGLKINIAALRKVHLGGKLEEGSIRWSNETQQKALALVQSQTKDAVEAFLDIDFLKGTVADIEAKAGAPVEDVVKTIELIGKQLSYSEEAQAGILAHFIQGGQLTAGGILNAVTSYAQVVASPDDAFDLEGTALQAMEVAYAMA